MRIQMIFRSPGELVRVKKPGDSYNLPEGLNDGDEVVILSPGYHGGGYLVEQAGKTYRVASQCVPHEHVSIPDPPTSATRSMRGYG